MSSKRRSNGRDSFNATPQQPQLSVQAPVENENSHEEIARLAYSFYEERQGGEGSPEEDWFRAEQELRSRRSQQPAEQSQAEQPQAEQPQVRTAGSAGAV